MCFCDCVRLVWTGPVSAKLQRYVSATNLMVSVVFKSNKTKAMCLKAKLLKQRLPYPPNIRRLAQGSDANISVPHKIDIVYISLLKTT